MPICAEWQFQVRLCKQDDPELVPFDSEAQTLITGGDDLRQCRMRRAGYDGCLGVPRRPPTHGRGALRQRAGKGQIFLGRVLEKHSSVRFGRPPSYWAGEGKRLQEPAHSAKTIILDDLERSAKIPGAGWQSGIGCIEAQCPS